MDEIKQKSGITLKNFPPSAIAAFGGIFALGAFLSYMLSDIWSSREDYAFGYLMPIFALYIFWDRLGKISSFFTSPVAPSSVTKVSAFKSVVSNLFFTAMFAAGILLYAFFAFLQILSQGQSASIFVTTIGFSMLVFSTAFFASAKNLAGENEPLGARWNFTLLFTFPAFAWIVSAPVFGAVESKISLFLLSHVASIVANLMDFFGFVVELHGNTITFPKGSVGVADACSGIRSLTACLFAGSFLAAVFLDKFWKKFALVASSMALAFFNNILRALFLSLWAYENGPDSISGFIHDMAGYFVLGMTIVGLFLLIPFFMINPVPEEFRNASKASDEKENASSDREK